MRVYTSVEAIHDVQRATDGRVENDHQQDKRYCPEIRAQIGDDRTDFIQESRAAWKRTCVCVREGRGVEKVVLVSSSSSVSSSG